MTVLNYLLCADSVIITTDTLTLTIEKTPHKYATKVFPLPHLKGVICGTGSLDIILEWFLFVQKNFVVKDIKFLDEIATDKLNEFSENYRNSGENTCTIYHFGFSEEDDRFVGFAYRSTSKYKSEVLSDGFGFKPPDGNILEYFIDETRRRGRIDLDLFINVIKKQKHLDDKKGIKDRVGIGGAIHFLKLNKNSQFIWECYTFEDYNELFQSMLNNLQER